MMEYEVTICFETHAELNTKTKVFCGCKNQFGGSPNTNCCEVCTGMPGALPLINRSAVEKTVMAGLATNCKISNEFYMDRKNYFYPDLSKAYQISQLYVPICTHGYLEIFDKNGELKKVPIRQIHLEEDAGKLVHVGGSSFVDYNRGGVPLIEIVNDLPGMSDEIEAMNYLNSLKNLLKFIGVSDCKMEQGQMRCDVNISVKKKGTTGYGVKTEMKNVNSFKAIERAIKYEVARQKKIIEEGGVVQQDTLRWDDANNTNYVMRSKENANDYRYFPEPDILPVHLEESEIDQIRIKLPMLPKEKCEKYVAEYGLTEYDALQLTKDKEISLFFDETIAFNRNIKMVSNWIQGEVSKIINEEQQVDICVPVSPKHFAKLLDMYEEGKISQASARTVLRSLWKNDQDPEEVVKAQGLTALSDESELETIIRGIIDKNPQAVNDIKSGNMKTMAFFVGQTMRATQGKADAGAVNKIVTKLLEL